MSYTKIFIAESLVLLNRSQQFRLTRKKATIHLSGHYDNSPYFTLHKNKPFTSIAHCSFHTPLCE